MWGCVKLNQWLQTVQMNPTVLLTDVVKHSIPLVHKLPVEQRVLIPKVLCDLYVRQVLPFHSEWIQQFSELMVLAGQRGHSFQGIVNKRPVWSYILQFRFEEVYELLDLPNTPCTFIPVNLSGYFGGLVKLAMQVQTQRLSIKHVIEQRRSPFNYAPVLSGTIFKDPASQLSIIDLVQEITNRPFPTLRPKIDFQPYKVRSHPKLPPQQRTLLHEAVHNAHHPMVKQLITINAPHLNDFWQRTPLHLAKIYSLEKIADDLQQSAPNTTDQKDGFGRTPFEIEQWKNKIIHTNRRMPPLEVDGGWSLELDSSLDTDKQDIDIVHIQELDWNRFARDYLSCLKPVIIRGVKSIGTLQKQWERDRFIEMFGHLEVEVGDIPYGGTLGRSSKQMPFAQFSKNPEGYVFSRLDSKNHLMLLKSLPKIPLLNRLLPAYSQFYQGEIGTGAPMHLHMDAWNIQVYGKKRWFLAPPFQGYYSARPIQQWIAEDLPNSTVMECTQQAGDIIYVPKYWSHAVVNVQESIGVATEFYNPYAM